MSVKTTVGLRGTKSDVKTASWSSVRLRMLTVLTPAADRGPAMRLGRNRRVARIIRTAWLIACVGGLGMAQVAFSDVGQSSAQSPKEEAALEREKAAILDVIDRQAAAFWAKDFDRWADTWVHAPYVRRVGWSATGGVVSVEGWDAIGARMKKSMADDPAPNLTPAKLVRDHLNFRIQGDIAWVTFEQHGVATGDIKFDMAGLSYETRIFEKHDGKWKVAYLGYLLAGTPAK